MLFELSHLSGIHFSNVSSTFLNFQFDMCELTMVVGSAHQNQEFQLLFGEGDKFSLQKPILTSYFVVIKLRLDIILHDDDYHVGYQVGYFLKLIFMHITHGVWRNS